MFQVVLYQPEIPPNTGNIIRLCANTGCSLHLIKPLGFEIDDKRMRRAGLDYRDLTHVSLYKNWSDFRRQHEDSRIVTLSTHHQNRYSDFHFSPDDCLVFGPETRGLPVAIRETAMPDARLALPMMPGSRSLNLSNSVAVVVYEAWRQMDFAAGPSIFKY